MKITIAVADTVPSEAFDRVEAMANGLHTLDSSFTNTEIVVRRTPMDLIQTMVTDDDYARQKLVELLVEQALTGAVDSVCGAL